MPATSTFISTAIKWFIISILTLTLLLILLASVPFVVLKYYQDDIRRIALTELNRQMGGHITLQHMKIDPFKHFPYVSIDLQGLDFYTNDSYTAEHIYHLNDVYLGFDIKQLLSGNYSVRKISLSKGFLHLVTDANGQLNLLEAKRFGAEQEVDTSASEALHFDLDTIELNEIHLTYKNRQTDKWADVFFQGAKAQFSMSSEAVAFRLDMVSVLNNYTSGKTTYFKEKSIELHHDMVFDKSRNFLEIRPGKAILQNGTLDFGGTIDFEHDMDVDFKIEGRKKNFDLFFALAPEAVSEAMKQFVTTGDVYFNAVIKGKTLNANPYLEVVLGCNETFLKDKNSNTDIVKDLQFRGVFNTGKDNTLATSVFYLESLYGLPKNSFIRGNFKIENFEQPLINMDLHADIDLLNLPELLPNSIIEKSTGKLKLDITLDEFVAAQDALQVATELKDGSKSRVVFKNAAIKFKSYPHVVERINGTAILDGDAIRLDEMSARIKNSDLKVSFFIDDLLHYLHGDNVPMKCSLKLDADQLYPGELVYDDLVKKLPEGLTDFWSDEIKHFHAEVDVKTTTAALRNYTYLPELALHFHDFRYQSKHHATQLKELSGFLHINDDQVKIQNLNLSTTAGSLKGNLMVKPIAPLFDSIAVEPIHYSTELYAPYFDVKRLLTYKEKCLLNDQIRKEEIKKLDVKLHGQFMPPAPGAKGMLAALEIDRFNLQINELPPIKQVKGIFISDTLGHVYLKNFYAGIGNTDVKIDLSMKHLLDPAIPNKKITGAFKTKKLDVAEIKYKVQKAQTWKQKGVTQPRQSFDDEDTFNIFKIPFPEMQLNVDIEHFIHDRFDIKQIKGSVRTTPNHLVYLDSVHMQTAGGALTIHGYFNGSNPSDPYLTGVIQAKDIDLNKTLYKFDNFGQEFMVSQNLRGIATGSIQTKAHFFADFTIDLPRSQAVIDATIRNGRLINFTPLQAMSVFMGDNDLMNIHFGELTNRLELKNGTLHIPQMKLASSGGYMYLSGRQNLDESKQMNYEMRLPLQLVKQASWNVLKSKLFGSGRRNRNTQNQTQADTATAVAAIPPDDDLVEEEREIISGQRGLLRKYITVRMEGTSDNLRIRLGKGRGQRS